MKTLRLLALAVLTLGCSLTTGCSTNKAVLAAAGGQAAGAVALVDCSKMVTRNPAAAPLLLDQITKARAIVAAGSPLLGIFSVTGPMDAQTKLALSVISGVIADQERAAQGIAMQVLNGCEMGVTLTAPPVPKP